MVDLVLSVSPNLILTVVKQILFIGRDDKVTILNIAESPRPLFEITYLDTRLEVLSSRGSNILCFCIWQYFPLILL